MSKLNNQEKLIMIKVLVRGLLNSKKYEFNEDKILKTANYIIQSLNTDGIIFNAFNEMINLYGNNDLDYFIAQNEEDENVIKEMSVLQNEIIKIEEDIKNLINKKEYLTQFMKHAFGNRNKSPKIINRINIISSLIDVGDFVEKLFDKRNELSQNIYDGGSNCESKLNDSNYSIDFDVKCDDYGSGKGKKSSEGMDYGDEGANGDLSDIRNKSNLDNLSVDNVNPESNSLSNVLSKSDI